MARKNNGKFVWQEGDLDKVEWFWWEVQFIEKESDALLPSKLEALIEPLAPEDADQDENDNPLESTSFIESDIFCVVKTVTRQPIDALNRALLQLRPEILDDKKDIQWHNLKC